MADKFFDGSGSGLPLVPALGAESVLTATPTVTAPEAELGYSTDTKLMWFRRAAQGVMRAIVEYWPGSPTYTDAAPTAAQTGYRLSIQEVAPTNAYSIRFKNPGGADVDFWLVLVDD